MAQGCVYDVCHGQGMFRAEVGMEEAFSPSIMQLLGMEFRPSGSIALTHRGNLSGPLDFTRNSNDSF